MWSHTSRPNTCKMKRPIRVSIAKILSKREMRTECISVQSIKKNTEWPDSGKAIDKVRNMCVIIPDFHAQREEYISRGLAKVGNQWKCLICDALYLKRNGAESHIEATHLQDDFLYSCEYCQNTFKTRNAYRVHISKRHKEEHRMAKVWGSSNK